MSQRVKLLDSAGELITTTNALPTSLTGSIPTGSNTIGAVVQRDTAGNAIQSASVAGLATALAANVMASGMYATNGGTMDAWRNNTEGTLLASAARTVDTSSGVQTNYNAKGVAVTLNVTGNPGGAETLSLILFYDDPASSSTIYVAVTGVVITAANGIRTLIVYPGAVETIANSEVWVQGVPVGRNWGAIVDHSGAGSWTYSLGYQYIV